MGMALRSTIAFRTPKSRSGHQTHSPGTPKPFSWNNKPTALRTPNRSERDAGGGKWTSPFAAITEGRLYYFKTLFDPACLEEEESGGIALPSRSNLIVAREVQQDWQVLERAISACPDIALMRASSGMDAIIEECHAFSPAVLLVEEEGVRGAAETA